jgi:hypothetical protein
MTNSTQRLADYLARIRDLTDTELRELDNLIIDEHNENPVPDELYPAKLDRLQEFRNAMSAEFLRRHPTPPEGWFRRDNPEDRARLERLQHGAMPLGPDEQGGEWITPVGWGSPASIRGWGPFLVTFQEDGVEMYEPDEQAHFTWEQLEERFGPQAQRPSHSPPPPPPPSASLPTHSDPYARQDFPTHAPPSGKMVTITPAMIERARKMTDIRRSEIEGPRS